MILLALACGPRGAERGETKVGGGSRSPAPAPVVGAPLTGDPLVVATYNINFGNGHSPQTVRTIADLDADLVLLQETTEDSEAMIRAALGEDYPEIRFRHCCRAGGLGVLSRYPIVEDGYLDATVGFFPAWWYRVDAPGGPLVALNVHLRPPISDGGSWVVGFFSTGDERAREIANFWNKVPKGLPTLVAGDFNENERGAAVKVLADFGLTSALPQFAPKADTWQWQLRGGGRLRMRLDHVIVDSSLVPTGAEVVEAGYSDHFPVVVTLRRAPG